MSENPTTTATPIKPPHTPPSFTIRPHRPGDLGYMIHRQALHYASEIGWVDGRFEAVLAKIASDFLTTSLADPTRERFWIAEKTSSNIISPSSPSSPCSSSSSSSPSAGITSFAGSVMLIKDPGEKNCCCWAMLRVLFVEPEMQGSGLGAKLVKLCVDTAKEVGGYKGIRLKTGSGRVAARKLYARFGFRLVDTKPGTEFGGGDGDAEVWELAF